MMHTNAKAMPINDNDYIHHITAVELVNQSYEVYITLLVINSLRRGDTHMHIYRQNQPQNQPQNLIRTHLCYLGNDVPGGFHVTSDIQSSSRLPPCAAGMVCGYLGQVWA